MRLRKTMTGDKNRFIGILLVTSLVSVDYNTASFIYAGKRSWQDGRRAADCPSDRRGGPRYKSRARKSRLV